MAYSFPHTLTPGTPENVTDVMDNFTGHATDTEYAYSTYKTILTMAGWTQYGLSSLARLFVAGVNADLTPPDGANAYAAQVFYIDKADYASASRTTKFRVRAQLSVNTVAPTVDYAVGLYPVTACAGAAGNVTWTLGTVTSGSTVTFTTPSASSQNQGNSGDFTAPAAGYYALGVLNSGGAALNCRLNLGVQLQVRQV